MFPELHPRTCTDSWSHDLSQQISICFHRRLFTFITTCLPADKLSKLYLEAISDRVARLTGTQGDKLQLFDICWAAYVLTKRVRTTAADGYVHPPGSLRRYAKRVERVAKKSVHSLWSIDRA